MENDSSWIYNQSGVVAYRLRQNDIEILLITTRHRKRWILPKGIIDPGFSPSETAVNEAFEEAGIKGKIGSNPIGEYRFKKWGGQVTVQVFPFEVTQIFEEWPEDLFRKRKWVGLHEAIEMVDIEGLKDILRNLEKQLGEQKDFKI